MRTRYIGGMLRYLRIAAAVVFALLAWAFIVLWVRSYSNLDELSGPIGGNRGAYIVSNGGVVLVMATEADPFRWPNSWTPATFKTDRVMIRGFKRGVPGIASYTSAETIAVGLSHWFLAACSFATAALLYFKKSWRFTTRGLLIATTIIAAVLGLIVYLIQRP